MKSSIRITLRLLVLLAAGPWLAHGAERKPALVLVISIDQFRYDYLERFRACFGPGGFNLLLENGADFADCHHRHSHTKTAPGHAVMLTGVYANVHGIIANDWLDRGSLERVSCVGDPAEKILGLWMDDGSLLGDHKDPRLGRSPRNLMATTVGDEMKLTGAGRGKVIGISNKDRAAILMAGRMADAAYFMAYGRMVSSTYYMDALPAWVRDWNAAGKADAYFGRQWDRLLPVEAYAIQDADDMPGEDQTTAALGNTLPKLITGGAAVPGPAFYDAFESTPFSNEVLADFARTAIAAENLGGRPGITDLLCLSFSANDHIGHLYGPDSHEIMDNVVRMDRTLAELFRFIDERVGLEHCTIVLTADHGVSSTPEHVHAHSAHVPAGRVDGRKLLATCEAALNARHGVPADGKGWVARDDSSLLLREAALADRGVTRTVAAETLRQALLTLDFVQAAYTRDQLEQGKVADELGRMALRSFNRERSGDVYFQNKPFHFGRSAGANHVTPYNYDTHVPLLWHGVGVTPGRRTEPVGMEDLAPTLAHILGIPAPPMARGRILF